MGTTTVLDDSNFTLKLALLKIHIFIHDIKGLQALIFPHIHITLRNPIFNKTTSKYLNEFTTYMSFLFYSTSSNLSTTNSPR